MLKSSIKKTIRLADGREITLETGKLARQADGAIVLTMGKTMLLATVVAEKEAVEGMNFLPLSVDYQERFAAAGKIPGGFLKREGRLSDHEILVSRLVDRAIRPLFPKKFRAAVQVNLNLISADEEVNADALAALATSAALCISPIPFNGPISEARVVRANGAMHINPSNETMKDADIDLIVGATEESVLMVEGEMNEVSEEDMLEAIKFAHESIKLQCQVQKELAEAVGVTKREYQYEEDDETAKKEIHQATYEAVYEMAKSGIDDKQERKKALHKIADKYLDALPEDVKEEKTAAFHRYFDDIKKQAIRNVVLTEKSRLDGRKLDEIRPIWCETDYLPAAHGSSVFTRGDTQSLTTVTLGGKLDEQLIDGAMISGYNRFMLHYNFPGYSTGEVKPNRGASRREIGHGNLAMRALKKVLPPEEANPYTIRVVSDILESNGSSSMATVCAGALALMDAGVSIKKSVSGIAMGLISDESTGNYAVLSDILGDEDFLGDMDFKVAGTKDGITACQMDIKVGGLSYDILQEALQQAKKGRAHILGVMDQTLPEPRGDYKAHAPRITMMKIAKEMIGAVIGPGGKVIQEMQRETGATIMVEEVDGEGIVRFFAANKESIDDAQERVKQLTTEPEIGEVYTGKVKAILPFGAFVEFLPGKDGLLHISEVKWERIDDLEKVLELGEEITVKLVDIDPKTKKYRLSRKVLLPKDTEGSEE